MNKRFLVTIPLVIALLIMSCVSVNIGGGLRRVRGSGNVTVESRQVSGFERVALSGIGDLQLTQGEGESLEVEAEDNLLEYLITEVRGDTLFIEIRSDQTTIDPTKPIKYRLTMKDISGIEVSGAGDLEAGEIQASVLDVECSGAGSVEIESLQADKLAVFLSGTGRLEVAGGKVENLKIDISGAGAFRAPDLESQVADVQISGTGSAKIWVTETLDAALSGTSSVEYYGQPSITQDTSGTSSVKSLGAHP